MAESLERPLQLVAAAAPHDHGERSHLRQLPLELGERAARVEGDGDGTAAEDPEVGHDEGGARRKEKGHAPTGSDPFLAEMAPHRSCQGAQLAVGEPTALVAQRNSGGRMTLDYGGQVHGRAPGRSVSPPP